MMISLKTSASVLLVGLATSFLAPTLIAEPWDLPAFTAEPKVLRDAAKTLPTEADADVQLLLIEQSYRFEEDGRNTWRYRMIFRVLSPSGAEQGSNFGTVWSPWHQERPLLEARVITAAGDEYRLDPGTISEAPVGDPAHNILSDRLRLRAPLPAIAVDSVIEEVAEIRDTLPLFKYGTAFMVFFGQGLPVHKVRLVIDAPSSLPLRHVTRLLPDVEPQRTVSGDRVHWVFEAREVEAIESIELLTPGRVPVQPLVAFSTGASWATVAQHYSEIVDAQIGKADLAEIVRRATRGVQDRHTKIERLLAWLQSEIRYTGLEFGEAAIVPRPPAETLERKYGDCKDKAALLVALLREVGMEAYLALLSTGPGMDVEPELPGFGLFDHAIVHLPGEDELWIDPTAEFAAAGELPIIAQGRQALVAGPQTTGLVMTPVAGPGENRSVDELVFSLDADLGGARVAATKRAWGSIGRHYRSLCALNNPAELEKFFASYVESWFAAEELLDWQHTAPDDLAGPFEIRLEARDAKVAFTDMNEAVVAVHPSSLLELLPDFVLPPVSDVASEPVGSDIIGERQHELELLEPYAAEFRFRIVPPPGYLPADMPEPEVRQLGPASLTREVAHDEDGTVRLNLRFDTGKRRLTPEEVEALRAGAQEVLDSEILLVRFEQTGQMHLASGAIGEALDEFDRLIALTPARALPHIRRSNALLAAGLGEAARREARMAIELEPELSLAYSNLAWILQHDLLGRLRHKGFDHAAAEAAYRRAVELEPANVSSRLDLAILLEHDHAGFRYSSEARLDEAIDAYREIFSEFDETGFEDNLLHALARAGRFEEMHAFVRDLESTANRDALRLVAVAATRGAKAAVREARRLALPEGQQTALASSGQLLIRLRRYEEAAELLTAAARDTANPTTLLELAERIRKTRRYDELELSESHPKTFVQRLIIASLQDDRQALSTMLSNRLDDEARSAEIARLRRYNRQLRATRQQREISIASVIDLVLANLELSLDGDASWAYRARARWPQGDSYTKTTYFLVREGESYRLLGSGRLSAFGAQALHWLRAGQPEIAARWLDWARERIGVPDADDPFAGEPLHHFWGRGSDRGAATIRLAAASLLTRSEEAEKVLPVLVEGRERAAAEHRRPFDVALIHAHAWLGHNAEALALAESWYAENPESRTAFIFLQQALARLERWDDAERVARERLELLPGDTAALRRQIIFAQRNDDLDREDAIYRQLIDLDAARSSDYNNLAWNAVVRGEVNEKTLELARRAVTLSGSSSSANLHTMASVYAELDRGAEARGILLQGMAAAGYDEPQEDDWYVLGRIAQSYGIIDAAVEAYRRLQPSDDGKEPMTSTYWLAQRHLEALSVNSRESA